MWGAIRTLRQSVNTTQEGGFEDWLDATWGNPLQLKAAHGGAGIRCVNMLRHRGSADTSGGTMKVVLGCGPHCHILGERHDSPRSVCTLRESSTQNPTKKRSEGQLPRGHLGPRAGRGAPRTAPPRAHSVPPPHTSPCGNGGRRYGPSDSSDTS